MENYLLSSKWDKYKTSDYYTNNLKFIGAYGIAYGTTFTVLDSIFMHINNPRMPFTKLLSKTPKMFASNLAIATVGLLAGYILGNLTYDCFSKHE